MNKLQLKKLRRCAIAPTGWAGRLAAPALAIVFFLGMIGLVHVPSSFAELLQPVSDAPAASTEEITLEGSAAAHTTPPDLSYQLEAIAVSWQETQQYMRNGDHGRMQAALSEMRRLREEAGISALEEESLFLIDNAAAKIDIGQNRAARYLVREALLLSPDSIRVRMRALTVAPSMVNISTQDIRGLVQRYDMLLQVAAAVVYPLLFSLAAALYLMLIAVLVDRMEELLAVVARRLPVSMRGFLAPPILIFLIAAPCVAGPFWALFAWSSVCALFLPRFRGLSVMVGALLLLCAGVVPLRENIQGWLMEPGIHRVFAVGFAAPMAEDRISLQRLRESRPDDAAVHYAYGQLMRRLGEYAAAKEAFGEVDRIIGQNRWTQAQLGMAAFVQGDSRRADQHYQEAHLAGLSSAALSFNHSKAKFKLFNTEESRELVLQARRRDEAMVERLEKHEESLGILSDLALAEVNLPINVVVNSALRSSAAAQQRTSEIVGLLMPGSTILGMAACALLLLCLPFAGTEQRKRMVIHRCLTHGKISALLSETICIMPGAAFVIEQRVVFGTILLAALILLAMPLFSWPGEAAVITSMLRGGQFYYFAAIAPLAAAVSWWGASIRERTSADRSR